MKKTLLLAAMLAATATPALASRGPGTPPGRLPDPIVDGSLDTDGAYGAAKSQVSTDPNAPQGNFQAPTDTARAGYDVYLADNGGTGGSLYGLITQTGGTAVGPFANLYFDLNPSVGDGSDLGFELSAGGVTAFIPGKNGQSGFSTVLDSSLYSFASVLTADGMTNIEFSLANSLFTSPIAGLDYYPNQTFEGTQTLNLSQSLSYSVAGGSPPYGPNRLGAFNVSGAVPEPATWAMMLVGFGAVGFSMRRKRREMVAQIA